MFKQVCCQNIETPRKNDFEVTYFDRGKGAYLFDKSGQVYIDFMNGFGSITLGYDDLDLKNMLYEVIEKDAIFLKTPTEYLDELSGSVLEDYENCSRVSFFTTGTSAVKAAVSMAKKSIGKKLILSSGYHGWDEIWEQSKKPFQPNCHGIIDFYFILEEFERLVDKHKSEIAAVVISPDLTYFDLEYYAKINEICKVNNLILILDDVKLGYRYRLGASIPSSVLQADIYVVSKCISNGSRISLLIGKEDKMRFSENLCFTSFFDVYSTVSAVATLRKIKSYKVIESIKQNGDRFIDEAKKLIKEYSLPIEIHGNGNLFQFVFGSCELNDSFYRYALINGLIFFKDDNQCPSYAFNRDICTEAVRKFENVLKCLKDEYSNLTGKVVSPHRIALTAYNQIDGCIEKMDYHDKIQFVERVIYSEEN